MRWSYRIGSLCGIDIYVHVTFFLLLLWAFFSHGGEMSWIAGLFSVALVLIVFSIVVLHELGHSLAARRIGIATKDINLLPIGGVARLETMPEKPWDELFVASAGPFVNLVLGGLFILIQYFALAPLVSFLPAEVMYILVPLVKYIIWTNISLLLFNLVPAFPMDGGRILRAVLGFKMDFLKATQWAVKVGKVFAVIFAIASFFYSNMLLFIAIFVWYSGSSELKMVQYRHYINQFNSNNGNFGFTGGSTTSGQQVFLVQGPAGWQVVTRNPNPTADLLSMLGKVVMSGAVRNNPFGNVANSQDNNNYTSYTQHSSYQTNNSDKVNVGNTNNSNNDDDRPTARIISIE